MSIQRKFRQAAAVIGVAIASIAGYGCQNDPKDHPTPGGDGQPTNEVVIGSTGEPSEYVAYNPVDTTFQVDAGTGNTKSSIKLKAKLNTAQKTIDKDGFTSLLNADNIDIDKTTSGASSTFASLKREDLPFKISVEGSYIGKGSTAATEHNKILYSQYKGTRDVMLINTRNNGLTPTENVERFTSVLRKIQSGELKLELVGKDAQQGGVVYNVGLVAK